MKTFFFIFGILLFVCKGNAMEYNAHALGNYRGFTYLNCKEALEHSYKTGFRFFEVDIQLTSDGHFVAYHLWTQVDADNLFIPFNVQTPVPDLKTFLNYRYLTNVFPTGLTPLTLENIFDFMKKYSDITVMFDFLTGYVDRDNPELMQNFASKFTDREIIGRSVVETYSLNNARYLYEAGYPNVQPWIDMPENSEKGFQTIEEILSFIKKYNIKNVSMSSIRIKNHPTDLKSLHKAGVRVFSPGWNSVKDLKDAEKLGLDIATTDLPMYGGAKIIFLKQYYHLLSHVFWGESAKKYKEKYKKILDNILIKK